ncbi:hypothetical protein NNC19_05010 [Clostridium sp. SHJSY1]|uniref:hypothetical protein n=1 Tax=Clostridium sp. SHJSY1 TaxID=2942483 RepID=UPI002875A0CF|nr:hypothetical protein [Clostridium sp. SHJSY1]MDS0525032.1 hypothetical protein [Clostridium sp. SHJSY1]
MEILFKDTPIGKTIKTSGEQRWVYGEFEPYDNFEQYRELFKAIVCEDGFDLEEFDSELLDENNWFIINENQETKGIEIPAIYEDGDIAFRYR